MRGMRALGLLLVGGVLSSAAAMASEKMPIMGAGPSTALVTLFFEHFGQTAAGSGYEFEVDQRSIKHAGGILASDKYLFGRTGRPLNEEEKASGKAELFLGRIPLAFVVGSGALIKHIDLVQLEDVYLRRISNWQALGGADAAIVLAGRESSEAALGVLKQDHPFFNEVVFDRVLERDHQMVNFIKSTHGQYAIGFGARSNFDTEYLLEVEGFVSGVNVGLVYDLQNREHPLVKAVSDYARSDAWQLLLKSAGFLYAQ